MRFRGLFALGMCVIMLGLAGCASAVTPVRTPDTPAPEASPTAPLTPTVAASSTPLWGGGRLLYSTYLYLREGGRDFKIINLDGTDDRVFLSHEDCHVFTWSPDRSRVTLVEGDEDHQDVYVAPRTNCADALQITDDPADDRWLVWSPDGSQLVFLSNRSGEDQLYLIRPDGTGLRQITFVPGGVAFAGWSPDGRQILFVSPTTAPKYQYPPPNDLFVINVTDRKLVQLTHEPSRYLASWSPDSARIALFPWDIAIINADGSNRTQITHDAGPITDVEWSPDGTTLAFTAFYHNARSEIYTIRADGTNLNQLTHNDVQDEYPLWSPDGRQIAYSSMLHVDYPVDRAIYIMNVDGSHPTRITHIPGDNHVVEWLPDDFLP